MKMRKRGRWLASAGRGKLDTGSPESRNQWTSSGFRRKSRAAWNQRKQIAFYLSVGNVLSCKVLLNSNSTR
jgi:hypothetical protein